MNTKTQESVNPKKINWFFNWGVGGYNNVMASTKEEAMQKALKLGDGWNSFGVKNLVPDSNFELTDAHEKSLVGMFD